MSLSDAKKLEDLKQKSNEILSKYYSGLDAQRNAAITDVIDSMTDYLKEQGFKVEIQSQNSRAFSASYKDISIIVEASRDDEHFNGADYLITITLGRSKKVQAYVNVKRGKRVTEPFFNETIANQLQDYESRYIPAIEALDPAELDGSYTLSIDVGSGLAYKRKDFSTGREVIDYLFES